MKNVKLRVIVVFSAIGIVGSLIATYQYFQILQTGFETQSFCTISEFINCDVAYASSHAKLFGIPLSWLGFVFYLWMGILAVWLLVKKQNVENISSFAWVLSAGGLIASIYKAYVSLVVLKVLCLICAAMYLVNLVLFFAWFRRPFRFKPRFVSLAAATLLVFGLGYIGMAAYHGKVTKASKLDIPVSEIVQFHFRASSYQLDIDPNTPVWGDPNAKVVVVEFSDFQCPFCKTAAFHLKPVLSEFKNKIRFYFYHFPLDSNCNPHISGGMHDKACLAAQASVCAQKQGDFWNYHDDIFRNQKNLSRELFIELAKKRGWNAEDFEKCIEAPEALSQVKANIEAGNKIYVTGTPTILVNNRRVKYWTDPEILRAIIKEEIKRSD